MAAPVPYHYTLLDLAKEYRVGGPANFDLSWNYRQPLSDLVPAERLYGMWEGTDESAAGGIRVAVRGKLTALTDVVRRLEQDLGGRLERSAAPRLGGVSVDGSSLPLRSRLWLEFNRLNVAIQELEGYVTRAMPIHEREARFKSARLTERLEGKSKLLALELMADATGLEIGWDSSLRVYRMAETSVDFNAKPGDLGYALVPEEFPELLSHSVRHLEKTHPGFKLRDRTPGGTVSGVGLSGCSIVNIDRTNLLIALRDGFRSHVEEMDAAGVANFRSNVTLDHVPFDISVQAIRDTLMEIGAAGAPEDQEAVRTALGLPKEESSQGTGVAAPREVSLRTLAPRGSGAEFLWDGGRLAAEPYLRADRRDRSELESLGLPLNPSQWAAWEQALSHRASIIWGPPGTGKTTTLAAVVVGAMLNAHREGRELRVLLTAFTYTAVDNLLAEVANLASKILSPDDYRIHRVRSVAASPFSSQSPWIEDVPLGFRVEDLALELVDELENGCGMTVVGTVPLRLNAMARLWDGPSQDRVRQWFDLIVIDEASQLSVGLSTLCVSKGDFNCTYVLGGDDLQLPPIQQADPPIGLEPMVGSVYTYLRRVHDVAPMPLQVNYRSNHTLVNFVKRAGYDEGLRPWSRDLKIRLEGEAPLTEKPSDWPADLSWSEGLADLLNPDEPAVCFVYDDSFAGQSNDFEAEVVAGLTKVLYSRIWKGLENELDPGGGEYLPVCDTRHDSVRFWNSAVGIVAPHRAQISSITSRLLKVFKQGHHANDVRGAVDTVERFQGQQRDVIIASFGVGDPDVIASEDEFLYNLNRFNVMASRARAKLVVMVTRTFLDHLSNDLAVMEQSKLLKYFAEGYCGNPRDLTLGTRAGTLLSAPVR